jgi:hypothetical protein
MVVPLTFASELPYLSDARALPRSSDRPRGRLARLANGLDRGLDSASNYALTLARNGARDLANTLDSHLDGARDLAHALDRADVIDRAGIIDLARDLIFVLDRASNRARALHHDSGRDLNRDRPRPSTATSTALATLPETSIATCKRSEWMPPEPTCHMWRSGTWMCWTESSGTVKPSGHQRQSNFRSKRSPKRSILAYIRYVREEHRTTQTCLG